MKVLIAVQDEHCIEALSAFAANYPWSRETHFKVLHVVPPVKVGSFMSVLPSPMLDEIESKRAETARAFVQRMAERIKTTLKTDAVSEVIVDGFPKEEILEEVNKWGADVVIIGSHRGGARRLMMGNVTQAVASNASCSVVVVPLSQSKKEKGPEGDDPEENLHIII